MKDKILKDTSTTYKDAGVDIEAGNRAVSLIKKHVKSTMRPEVVTDIGGFSAAFDITQTGCNHPLLVSGADGVGTKLKIAFLMDRHDTIGIDCVAMCVNDVLCCGAEPLFFLDYIASGKIVPEKMAQIVKGVASGCRQAGCALIGGETAEMPGFYSDGEYDIAGFCVGMVEKNDIITGTNIKPGDVVIGLPSNGLHSNGFSLVRKVLLQKAKAKLHDYYEDLGCTLGEELLKPTAIYVNNILDLMKVINLKGIAHITGGGLVENIPRILPENTKAVIKNMSWEKHPIFDIIQKTGKISKTEMFKTFNMGIGMVIVVSPQEADTALKELEKMGSRGRIIGEVRQGSREVSFTD